MVSAAVVEVMAVVAVAAATTIDYDGHAYIYIYTGGPAPAYHELASAASRARYRSAAPDRENRVARAISRGPPTASIFLFRSVSLSMASSHFLSFPGPPSRRPLTHGVYTKRPRRRNEFLFRTRKPFFVFAFPRPFLRSISIPTEHTRDRFEFNALISRGTDRATPCIRTRVLVAVIDLARGRANVLIYIQTPHDDTHIDNVSDVFFRIPRAR